MAAKIFLLGVVFRLSIRLYNAVALFEAFSGHMRQSPEEDVWIRFAGITVDIEANRCLSRQNIPDNEDIFSFRQQKVFATCSTCAGLPVVRFFILLGSLIPHTRCRLYGSVHSICKQSGRNVQFSHFGRVANEWQNLLLVLSLDTRHDVADGWSI